MTPSGLTGLLEFPLTLGHGKVEAYILLCCCPRRKATPALPGDDRVSKVSTYPSPPLNPQDDSFAFGRLGRVDSFSDLCHGFPRALDSTDCLLKCKLTDRQMTLSENEISFTAAIFRLHLISSQQPLSGRSMRELVFVCRLPILLTGSSLSSRSHPRRSG